MKISNGMYFTTCKSVHLDQRERHYWMLHQDTGHILHVSEPFFSMEACLADQAVSGLEQYLIWSQQGLS